MKLIRVIPFLSAIPIVAACMMATDAVPVTTSAPPDAATQVRQKALYSEKCSACHNLPDPVEKALTRSEWQSTVNKMLTKYGASDSISTGEAAQIVDYLATFAVTNSGNTGKPANIWATDRLDVWTVDPTRSVVTNFESPEQLTRLRPAVSGDKGGASSWHIVPLSSSAGVGGGSPSMGREGNETGDGHSVRVTAPGAHAGRFAMLVDPSVNAHDLNVSVRFRIDSENASPAVGVAFGVKSPDDYQLVRYDALHQQVSLLQIAGAQHATIQKIDIASGADLLTSATTTTAASLDKGWHTLRVLVNGTTVRAWIDMTKRLSIDDTAYQGGAVALWSQGDTTADFTDWITDIYDSATASL